MQKLELTWIGKGQEPAVEPRILLHDPSRDYGDANAKNMLIHGDNLLALKALEQEYAGQVKCVYIDPPYNTGAAFEHYDDNLEHSIWLSLMAHRLKVLRNLLSEDGIISVQIDATEMSYLKVLMDEIFHRKNFINIISCKAKIAGVSGSHLGKSLQDNIEYILVYAKNIELVVFNAIPQKSQELSQYIKQMQEDGKSWKYTSILKELSNGEYIKSFQAGNGDEIRLFGHPFAVILSVNSIANQEFSGDVSNAYYRYIDRVFRTTNAQTSIRTKVIAEKMGYNYPIFSIEYTPIKGKNAGTTTRVYYKDDNMITWLKDVVSITTDKIFKLDNMGNLWDDIQYNNLTKEGNVQFPNGKKPEQLLSRMIDMVTQDGDLVLDSFLGSGTTAAVAHKMGRRYIGIELGDHCYTHCIPRLKAVVDGEQGGISKAQNWKGGGGFKFYELAPSLIIKDEHGFEIISKEYNPEMLAAAICKLCGYKYAPDKENPYIHGVNNIGGLLFVTTRYVSAPFLSEIARSIADYQSLVICAAGFQPGIKNTFPNVRLRKIPQTVLDKCEYGKDNYNLNIVELPELNETEEDFCDVK